MIHEIVHRYTCEGCGMVRITTEELTEFGPHRRGSSSLSEEVASEAACLSLTRERDHAIAQAEAMRRALKRYMQRRRGI